MSAGMAGQASAGASIPDFASGMDLATLWFFLQLYRTGSLPRTADLMGVSLSSANRMLAKLRAYWGEPLFERSGHLMVPLEGAKGRYERVLKVLHELKGLQEGDAVNPASLSRTVRLACYDNALVLGLGGVFSELAKRLPLVRFHVLQIDEHMFEDLQSDRLDLIFFARQGQPADIRSIPVLSTRYVCVVRRGHPLEKRFAGVGKLTRSDLAPWPQVLVNAQPDRNRDPNGPGNGYFNPADPGKVAAVIPFFLAAPVFLANSDCYAIVPEALALSAFDRSKLAFLPVTDAAPRLTMKMGWHERTHRDPALQFIRSVLKDLIEEKRVALGLKEV